MSETQKNKELQRTDSLSKYLVGRARDSLLTYTQLTYPKYRANWHHELIIERLESVARGEIRRLMILVPPRYGKSELSSIRFPAWYLGQRPEKKVILASYNDRFALHFGKHARNLCQSDMHATIFPSAHVRKDSSSGSLWELKEGGKFVAVGRGGSVTGHGANVLILDDLVKNIQEAYSENVRDTVWDWYKTTLYTRIEEDASIVIVNTRWHRDDLVGRLLDQEGEKWAVLKLPAIADTDYSYGDYEYREAETLWPAKFSLDNVLETKKVLGSHFSSIYQQEPEERQGNIIKRDYWKKYYARPDKVLWTVQSWDTGFKTGQENSYSACTTWLETEEGYYLAHAWWDRVSFPDLKKTANDLYEKFRPNEVLIEDKASGQSLIQELSISTKIPVKSVKPTGDKSARAHAVTPLFEAGKVNIAGSEEWTEEVINCAASFPRTKNTDVVDSATQALEYLRHGRRFRYSYHGGAYSRERGRKSIFQLEKEKKMPEGKLGRAVLKKRDQYRRAERNYRFFEEAYKGGSDYINSDHLYMHTFEDSESFRERKYRAYYYNYCAPIVNAYNSFIYRQKVARNFGELEENGLFRLFLDNSDKQGNSYEEFVRNISKWSSVTGIQFILVDKPGEGAETMKDELEQGIHPYFVRVSPLNVWDWGLDKWGNLLWVKLLEKDQDEGDFISSRERFSM